MAYQIQVGEVKAMLNREKNWIWKIQFIKASILLSVPVLGLH